MPEEIITDDLDRDQELILAVYSFYTKEKDHSYLQYTAACAIFYYLTQKGYFIYNLKELLVYDYNESRRYIWEAKKFMNDINVIRDHDLLIRARIRSKTYRDVNAHQCSTAGHWYIDKIMASDPDFKNTMDDIRRTLSNEWGELYDVVLEESGPMLRSSRGRDVPIQDFLKNMNDTGTAEEPAEHYKPFFI